MTLGLRRFASGVGFDPRARVPVARCPWIRVAVVVALALTCDPRPGPGETEAKATVAFGGVYQADWQPASSHLMLPR